MEDQQYRSPSVNSFNVNRSLRSFSKTIKIFWRRSQVAKAVVCKTIIPQFDSGRRLHGKLKGGSVANAQGSLTRVAAAIADLITTIPAASCE